jgi:hypothetical protein
MHLCVVVDVAYELVIHAVDTCLARHSNAGPCRVRDLRAEERVAPAWQAVGTHCTELGHVPAKRCLLAGGSSSGHAG